MVGVVVDNIVGTGLTALLSTTIEGTEVSQIISGHPTTSGTGVRIARLAESSRVFVRSIDGVVRPHNVVNMRGFSTADWETISLARELFNRALGIDITASRVSWQSSGW